MAESNLEPAGVPSGEESVEALIGQLRAADEATRASTIEALSASADPRTSELVKPLLDDPDENVRVAAMQVILLRMGQRGGAKSGATQPAEPQELTKTQKFGLHVGMFVVGAILWALGIAFLVLMTSLKLGPLNALGVVIGLIPLVLLIARSIEGWNVTFVEKDGSPSLLYKIGVYLAILFAGVGLLLSCYWTGRLLLRSYFESQSDAFRKPLPLWFLGWLVKGNAIN